MKNNDKHIENELKGLEAENLLRIKALKDNIPENYFENLNSAILKKIKIEKVPKQSISRRFIVPFSIAATILLLLSITFLNKTEADNSWSAVSFNDLETYIGDNIEDFSEEELASLSNSELSILDFSEETSDEELLDYLINSEMADEEMF